MVDVRFKLQLVTAVSFTRAGPVEYTKVISLRRH